MEKKKRTRNKNVDDSARESQSYPSSINLEIDQLTGSHQLSDSDRKQIAKDIRDLNIEPFYSRGETVFSHKEVIQNGYRIHQNALCWIEQIIIRLEKIEQKIESKVEAKKEEKIKRNVKGENEYKVYYVLLYDWPDQPYLEAGPSNYEGQPGPDDGYIMFELEENDIGNSPII